MRIEAGSEVREVVESIALSRKISGRDKKDISEELHIPLSAVESVSSFYYSGQSAKLICSGLPCRLKSLRGETMDGDWSGAAHVSCLGYCDHAPVVRVNGTYMQMEGNDLHDIEESSEDYVKRNREDITEYSKNGGYSALEELAGSKDYSYVLERIESAELRGMGGAGFPVHLKWKSFRSSRKGSPILLVNAHEGEPGTFKDREIMELYPHTLLEGALITGIANGVNRVIIGLKREYSNAYSSLMTALNEIEERLGSHIGDKLLPVVEIIRIGGYYITGEETALIEAIEGKRSEPRLRPPFPTQFGIHGNPTLVHNVETLSVIPEIVGKDSVGFRKTYCLTGDVNHTGTVREYAGSTVSDLIEKYGATSPHSIRAFLPGGLSGGILPAPYLSEKIDGKFSERTGASTGTGAIIALSDKRCVVDIASTVEDFFADESCGKCGPCRLGTHEISALLRNLRSGHGNEAALKRGKEVAESMMKGSMCALGQAAGKFYLDASKYFDGDFTDHATGICSTGACSMEAGKQ